MKEGIVKKTGWGALIQEHMKDSKEGKGGGGKTILRMFGKAEKIFLTYNYV